VGPALVGKKIGYYYIRTSVAEETNSSFEGKKNAPSPRYAQHALRYAAAERNRGNRNGLTLYPLKSWLDIGGWVEELSGSNAEKSLRVRRGGPF